MVAKFFRDIADAELIGEYERVPDLASRNTYPALECIHDGAHSLNDERQLAMSAF